MAGNWLNNFRLKIITPNGTFLNKDVAIVTAKTSEGFVGILKGHSPLVASLIVSELHIGEKDSPEYEECAISGGLLCVDADTVTIITDAIENIKDIDIKRAREAAERAKKDISKYQGQDQNLEFKAKLALIRATNRINVKEKDEINN